MGTMSFEEIEQFETWQGRFKLCGILSLLLGALFVLAGLKGTVVKDFFGASAQETVAGIGGVLLAGGVALLVTFVVRKLRTHYERTERKPGEGLGLLR